MPVFHLEGEKVLESQLEADLSEERLRALFEAHGLVFIEPGLHLVDREVHAKTGRIDTLALDAKNRPVVIEYKIDEDASQGALVQALAYSRSVQDEEAHYEKLIRRKVPGLPSGKDLDFDSARIVIVAPDFDPQVVEAARQVTPATTLVRYRVYEGKKGHTITTDVVFDSESSRRGRSKAGDRRLESHFEGRYAAMKSIYDRLVEQVNGRTGVSPRVLQEYIAFSAGSRFLILWVYTDHIEAGIRWIDPNPPFSKPGKAWRGEQVAAVISIRRTEDISPEFLDGVEAAFVKDGGAPRSK